MTNIEKTNLRINNVIFYLGIYVKKSSLCKICGKPLRAHYNRTFNGKKHYCFPYGPNDKFKT